MVCPPRVERSIFAIVDAVGEKQCRKALAGIKDLLAAKNPVEDSGHDQQAVPSPSPGAYAAGQGFPPLKFQQD